MATPVAEPVRPSDATHVPATPTGRTPYTPLATAGLALMAAVPAFMLILGAFSGMEITGEDWMFFGTMIVVPAIAAGLVWRFGTWAKVLGILVAAAGAFMLFWTVFGLAYPGSLGDFVPGVAYPLGVLMAIGGSVAAIVARRRGRVARTVTPIERRLLTAAAALVVLAVLVAVVVGALQRDSIADADVSLTATIADFEFTEGGYEAAVGDTIRVHNADPFTHTFTVPDLDIHEVVVPGGDALVEIPGDAAAGTYTIYCEPHSDMHEPDPEQAGMASTLTIP